MSTTTVSRDMTLEDIQRALSDALGPAYKVTATSDSTLKVRRLPPHDGHGQREVGRG